MLMYLQFDSLWSPSHAPAILLGQLFTNPSVIVDTSLYLRETEQEGIT